MTTDQLSERINDLGERFGLAQIPRLALVYEILRLIREYEADLYEDVLAQFHRDRHDEMPAMQNETR